MFNFEVFDADGNGNSIREWVINCLKILLVRKTFSSNATKRKLKMFGGMFLVKSPENFLYASRHHVDYSQ